MKHKQKRIKNRDIKKFLLNRIDLLQKENNQLKLPKSKQRITLSQLMYFALIKLLPNPSTLMQSEINLPLQLGGFNISLLGQKIQEFIFIENIFYENYRTYVTFLFKGFKLSITIALYSNKIEYTFADIRAEVNGYNWDFSDVDLKIISDSDFEQMFVLAKNQKEMRELFWG